MVKKLAQLQFAVLERGTWATWVPGPVWVPEVEEVLLWSQPQELQLPPNCDRARMTAHTFLRA